MLSFASLRNERQRFCWDALASRRVRASGQTSGCGSRFPSARSWHARLRTGPVRRSPSPAQPRKHRTYQSVGIRLGHALQGDNVKAWAGDAAVGPVDPRTKVGRRDPRLSSTRGNSTTRLAFNSARALLPPGGFGGRVRGRRTSRSTVKLRERMTEGSWVLFTGQAVTFEISRHIPRARWRKALRRSAGTDSG